jgi:colicin import membrane protein
MTKKVKNSAPKTEKVNPEMEAANQELETGQAETTIASDAPEATQEAEKPQATPEKYYRTELVKKAQAAKAAAEAGLIPQEQADALWKEAQEACKPTEESLAEAKAAKEKKAEAEKAFKAAENAAKYGLVTEEVVKEKEAIAEAAKTAYTEAAKAAKGFSFGAGSGGGGLRFKGQMSGLDAALRILADSEKPLNAGAITKAAMEQGLWAPEGQTPASTMSALLQSEVKKGEKARFSKVGAGLYTIRKVATE